MDGEGTSQIHGNVDLWGGRGWDLEGWKRSFQWYLCSFSLGQEMLEAYEKGVNLLTY